MKTSALFRLLVLSLLVMQLASCSWWKPVEEPEFVHTKKGFSLATPPGWMRFTFNDDEGYIVSRDGAGIQQIRVDVLAFDKAFPTVKQVPTADWQATELATAFIAEINATKSMPGLKVLENRTAKVAGKNGFRVKFQFNNARGNTFTRETWGAVLPKGLLIAHYQAASDFHWHRDYPAFENTVKSLTLTN